MSRLQLILEFVTKEFKGWKFFWRYLKEFMFSLVWSGSGTCDEAGRWITIISITVSQSQPKWIKEPLSSLAVR